MTKATTVTMITEAEILAQRREADKARRRNSVPKIMISIKPLLEYLDSAFDDCASTRGKALGGGRDLYRQLIRKEKVNWITADRYAVALGMHPVLIWVDWYEITEPKKCA